MTDTIQFIRIHEHARKIAFLTEGSAETVYLTPKLALLFASELTLVANDIKYGSDYPTTTIIEE